MGPESPMVGAGSSCLFCPPCESDPVRCADSLRQLSLFYQLLLIMLTVASAATTLTTRVSVMCET